MNFEIVLMLLLSVNYSFSEYFDWSWDDGADKEHLENYNWDDPANRIKPNIKPMYNNNNGYVITSTRLQHIRSHLLYPFHDRGGDTDYGDFATQLHASMPRVHKNLNFNLPFFGFRFNYTRVSIHGSLEFSDQPEHFTYPLEFPIRDWPHSNDPSFIGIFFSKCRIGIIRPTDADHRIPGVYYRMERDLWRRTDRVGVELRERTKWDIREGIIGADTFEPKHVIVVTWKNMSFAGGIDNSLFKTNTFQMVIATDEVRTYAIFNYDYINWSTHTEAGGDKISGEGGIPAFIGFNAGNGTQSFEYKPYSQSSAIRDLTNHGWANGFPGRHIFRLDEVILSGSCSTNNSNEPLVVAPESGNMLGGTIINITGPCFTPTDRIMCLFDTQEVIGHFVDRNRVICVQPLLYAHGYVRFMVSIGKDGLRWHGRYFVEAPSTDTNRVYFDSNDVHLKSPSEIRISWSRHNLTTNFNAGVTISLYGYSEDTIGPQLKYIDVIEREFLNTGEYAILPRYYEKRNNSLHSHMQFGFIKINLTNPALYTGLAVSPILWSKPIPLAWYFKPQWEKMYGRNWPEIFCSKWFSEDRVLGNFTTELPQCPCTYEQALFDKGRFLPDLECDRDSNPYCLHNRGAIHCVTSGIPSISGSEQQCCYDRNGYLMMSQDQNGGSHPRRSHTIGQSPWNKATKVPSLSTWFNDIQPYYSCCMWQNERTTSCEQFRNEHRPTQDCADYQSPGVAAVFGDPHIITFNNLQYTFNGLGEFVLLRSIGEEQIDIQGRFEQVSRNVYGPVMATQLTSIVARESASTIIEVRLRPQHAQWRYRLDVFADGRRIFFDRQSLKFQHFSGVTVYTPTYILNQSEVVIMFPSGVGVEIVEQSGFMAARVYAPRSFINKTRGLFGNWSLDIADDFTLPNGLVAATNLNDFESIHQDFGLHWMLSACNFKNVGVSLFVRDAQTARSFNNSSFIPNFIQEPRDFLPPNRTNDIDRAIEICGESYQCRFDYGMSLRKDMAYFTKKSYDTVINVREVNERRLITCPVLKTPRFGRKSNFLFVPGTILRFECDEGFVLVGDAKRICTGEGHWEPYLGYTECLGEDEYNSRIQGGDGNNIKSTILPLLILIIYILYC